jgi:hypothetical protein
MAHQEEEDRPLSEDADEIIPGVWIGGAEVAANGAWLRKNGIVTVFNCTKHVAVSRKPFPTSTVCPSMIICSLAEIKNMEMWAPEIAYKIHRRVSTRGDRHA